MENTDMTTFDSAATLDAISILQQAKRASVNSAPDSVWQMLHKAQQRLDRELMQYLRGAQ
jgi:hypothetical protein